MSSVVAIATALLALSGVLAGIFVGVRRWKVERGDARSAQFTKDRQAAYRELWDSIQALDVFLRDESLSADAAGLRVREINAALIRHALYVQAADRDQMAKYVAALVSYQKLISADPVAHASFSDTAAGLPAGVTLRQIFAARDELTAMQEALADRVRRVLLDEDAQAR